MGRKYIGPNFEDLPKWLRHRIENASRVAENETALGVSVEGKSYSTKTLADLFWKFNGFKEVFEYRSGMLWQAYFRSRNTIYTLYITGYVSSSTISEDRNKIKKALGLEVTKRPTNQRKKANIQIRGKPLELIVSSGSATARDSSKYPYQVQVHNIYFLGRR